MTLPRHYLDYFSRYGSETFQIAESRPHVLSITPQFRDSLPETSRLLAEADAYDVWLTRADGSTVSRILLFWKMSSDEVCLWVADHPPIIPTNDRIVYDSSLGEFWQVLGGFQERIGPCGHVPPMSTFLRAFVYPPPELDKSEDWLQIAKDSDQQLEGKQLLKSIRVLSDEQYNCHFAFERDTGRLCFLSRNEEFPLLQYHVPYEAIDGSGALYRFQHLATPRDCWN